LHIIPVLVGCTTLVAAAASDASPPSRRRGYKKDQALSPEPFNSLVPFSAGNLDHLLSRFAFLRGRRD
jgi:hypothetical protein